MSLFALFLALQAPLPADLARARDATVEGRGYTTAQLNSRRANSLDRRRAEMGLDSIAACTVRFCGAAPQRIG